MFSLVNHGVFYMYKNKQCEKFRKRVYDIALRMFLTHVENRIILHM